MLLRRLVLGRSESEEWAYIRYHFRFWLPRTAIRTTQISLTPRLSVVTWILAIRVLYFLVTWTFAVIKLNTKLVWDATANPDPTCTRRMARHWLPIVNHWGLISIMSTNLLSTEEGRSGLNFLVLRPVLYIPGICPLVYTNCSVSLAQTPGVLRDLHIDEQTFRRPSMVSLWWSLLVVSIYGSRPDYGSGMISLLYCLWQLWPSLSQVNMKWSSCRHYLSLSKAFFCLAQKVNFFRYFGFVSGIKWRVPADVFYTTRCPFIIGYYIPIWSACASVRVGKHQNNVWEQVCSSFGSFYSDSACTLSREAQGTVWQVCLVLVSVQILRSISTVVAGLFVIACILLIVQKLRFTERARFDKWHEINWEQSDILSISQVIGAFCSHSLELYAVSHVVSQQQWYQTHCLSYCLFGFFTVQK